MGGGMLQLVATGIPDLYLTGDPQITWFKILYRRTTEFSMVDYEIKINGDMQFGDTIMTKIGPIADKLGRLSLIVDLPTPELKMKDPTVKNIKDLVQPYDITFGFSNPKKDSDIVKYDDLFNENDNSLGTQLVLKGRELNHTYNSRLNILGSLNSRYSISSNKFLGRYIAIQANKVILPENTDGNSYLLLTPDKTKEIIESNTRIIDLDIESFMYYTEKKPTQRSLTEPINANLTKTRAPTINDLIRIYPKIINNYTSITQIQDIDPINFDFTNKKYHLIISVDYLRKVKERNLYLRDILSDDTNNIYDDQKDNMNYDTDLKRFLLFNNFDFTYMIENITFETGYYTFDIDQTGTNEEYDLLVDQLMETLRINIPIQYIDTDISQQKFNRYTINENAFYDPTWVFSSDKEAYWLLDVEEFNNNIDMESNNNLVSINPKYLSCNEDNFSFAPYMIKQEWSDSITKKKVKLENVANGFDLVANIVSDLFNISFPVSLKDYTKTDISNVHKLMVAINNDIINTNNQTRNYKVENIGLSNATMIRDKISNDILEKIIYVDQRRLNYKYYLLINQYFRNDTEYITNNNGIYDFVVSNSSMVSNRNTIYNYTKYLMWSYYIENFIDLTNTDNQTELENISHMLIHIPINPLLLDPNDISGVGVTDPTMENIRFTQNELNDITKIQMYVDDSFIEKYDKLHRALDESYGDTIFDNKYIFAGTRYTKTSQEQDKGTCINREIEFYHVMRRLNHNNADNANKIYDHFINLISSSYDNPRNYKNTISYLTTEKYLRDYYDNVFIQDSNESLDTINQNIIAIMTRVVNITLRNYSKIVFGLWKNSRYDDNEINIEIVNNGYYVDFNSYYSLNYLQELRNNNLLTQYQQDRGDPMLIRAKFYTGIDINLRPRMGYTFKFIIDLKIPETYIFTEPKNLIYDNDNFIDKTNNAILGSEFRDPYAEIINNQNNKVINDIDALAFYNDNIKTNISYVLWCDLNTFMKIVVNDLNTDLGKNIQYFNNVAIMNHLPVMILYYYSQYLQYFANLYISSLINEKIIENGEYEYFRDDEEDIINNKKFNVEPEQTEDLAAKSALKFLGTDVRMNSQCPFHSYINNLPSNLDGKCEKFLITKDYSNVDKVCPLCFRTFEMRRLYNIIIKGSLLDSNYENIVDRDYIISLCPDFDEIDNNINNINNRLNTNNYTNYLFRQEPIFYDDVSQSYYHTGLNFVIHRIATILFRYRYMIRNLIDMSLADFTQFKNNNQPLPTQIGPPVEGKTEQDRYDEFIDYLESMRSGDIDINTFETQLDEIISVITHTDTRPASFNDIKSIFDKFSNFVPDQDSFRTYTEGATYIGSGSDLDDMGYYRLIPNIVYNRIDNQDRYSVLRYQMYRGNIVLWTLIQNQMIRTYNDFMNNVLDPREIGLSTDIHQEIYRILNENIDKRFVRDNGTIDYYRNDEIGESPMQTLITNMINYCRELMIYYNMLLLRYKKMEFMTGVNEITLDNDAYYYNFSQEIAKKYMESILTTINSFGIININEQENDNINRDFYYSDTSQYYYINKTLFRNEQENLDNPLYINDYNLFNYKNNFHLGQTYTVTELTEIIRNLGFHDTFLEEYSDTDSDLYYSRLANGIDVNYNDNFEKYVSLDTVNNLINNYEKYLYVRDVIFDTVFKFSPQIKRIYNREGVFSYIWYEYPTISNILYDRFYAPIIPISDVDAADPGDTYYETETVINRLYTPAKVTSPLVFIKDKISTSVLNQFTHTPYLKEWEDSLHQRAIDLFPDELLSRILYEEEEKHKIYGIYREFMGSYFYTDLVKALDDLIEYISTGKNSIDESISDYRRMIESMISKVGKSFDLNNTTEMRNQIIMLLTIELSKNLSNLTKIIDKRNQDLNNFYVLLNDFEEKVIAQMPNQSRKDIVAFFINEMRNNIVDMSYKVSVLNLTDLVNYVKSNINNINNIDDLTEYMSRDLNDLVFANMMFKFSLDISKSILIIVIQYRFIGTKIDDRVYTPSVLLKLQKLGIYNNFENYKDALTLILSNIITLITNNTTNTTSLINNNFLIDLDHTDQITGYKTMKSYIEIYIDSILKPLSEIVYLPRWIDTNRRKIEKYYRYDLDKIFLNGEKTYTDSDIYNSIVKILSKRVPKHAWCRYLGYRMIEEVSLIIDGEEIDRQDGDLMLLLHKMTAKETHRRGDDIMLGNIEEMYEISERPRPKMRLYIQFFLFFSRHYGNTLPLVNMIYSDARIKIKLRKLEDLLYIETGGELMKPVRIKSHLLGNYFYLQQEERKTFATRRSESLMENFKYGGTVIKSGSDIKNFMTSKNGEAQNILNMRYYFTDPCKYLIWKICVEYPDQDPRDKIFWDLSNYRVRKNGIINEKSEIINVINRTMIIFNGKPREDWKDTMYSQNLQPYNKKANGLDSGEYMYGFCLFANQLQPSGTTNFSEINRFYFNIELNPEIAQLMKKTNLKIKIMMWECSYNVFVAMSGFCGLRFYGSN